MSTNSYFITCQEVVKDERGEIVELRCTYDPETRSGSGFTGRKVKGTIHWVSANAAVRAKVRLYDQLFSYNEETKEYEINANSLAIQENALIEPSILEEPLGARGSSSSGMDTLSRTPRSQRKTLSS